MEKSLNARLVNDVFARGLLAGKKQDLKAALEATGIQFGQHPDRYPSTVWVKALDAAGEHYAPGKPPAEAHRVMGRRLFENLRNEGVITAPGLAVVRLMGPMRALKELVKRLQKAGGKFQLSLAQKSSTAVDITVSYAEAAHVLAGACEVALENLGRKDVRAHVKHHGAHAVLEVSWR